MVDSFSALKNKELGSISLAFDSCFAIIEALNTSQQYIYLVYIYDNKINIL